MNDDSDGPPLNDEARTRNIQEAILKVVEYLVRHLPHELRAKVENDLEDSQTELAEGEEVNDVKTDIRLLTFQDDLLEIPALGESLSNLIRHLAGLPNVHAS